MDIQTFYEKLWTTSWFEFIKANKTKITHCIWFSQNPNLTMDMIINNPDIAWSGFYLSLNPNLNMTVINKYPNGFDTDNPNNFNKAWSWANISRHKNITFDDVLANPDYPWDWNELSGNPNVTMEIVNANPHYPWLWGKLCFTRGTSSSYRWMFHEYYFENTGYRELLQKIQNENTTEREWHEISYDKHLTIECITNNIDKPWIWSSICNHTFAEDRKCFVEWNVKWILLAMMHEQLDCNCEDVGDGGLEYVLFDAFLAKSVAKY